jgi:hypothetical protein
MRRLIENLLRKIMMYAIQIRMNVVNNLIEISVTESTEFLLALGQKREFELFSSRLMIQKRLVELILEESGDKENHIFLEFGVFKGESLKFFSSQLPKTNFFGFDSFKGLEENFGGINSATFFNLKGRLPRFLRSNVKLIVGDCTSTIENFPDSVLSQKIVAVHMDLDVYGATKKCLEVLSRKLTPGSYILFDEMFGNPFWKNGEYAALTQVFQETQYDWIAIGPNQALIRIK